MNFIKFLKFSNIQSHLVNSHFRLTDSGGNSTVLLLTRCISKCFQFFGTLTRCKVCPTKIVNQLSCLWTTDGRCCTVICTALALFWIRSTILRHIHNRRWTKSWLMMTAFCNIL